MNGRPSDADDAALSALIDGALAPEEAEHLARRLAAEPALARRLAELKGVDEALRASYGGIADEPLPAPVTDAVRRAARLRHELRPTARRRSLGLPVAATAGLAAAAGFALALVVVSPRPPRDPRADLVPGARIARGSRLHDVLHETPSGMSLGLGDGWSATPRLSFADVTGAPCRRLDVGGATGTLAALACRREGEWRVELVGVGGAVAGEGSYRPAGGEAASAIDAAIEGLIEGDPLGRDAEGELIARGWD